MDEKMPVDRLKDMNQTPDASRKHIAIFGKTNSGKSALLNAIIGQEIALVSPIHGTTTDPVRKAMELLPFGPVVFIDTAGLSDLTELGALRMKRSYKVLPNTDFAIYVMDIHDLDQAAFDRTVARFDRCRIPFLTVINKIDTADVVELQQAKLKFPEAVFVSAQTEKNILFLKEQLVVRLADLSADQTILGDLVPANGTVVMVVPVDSEAPKGRIILPQVQLIRDCLDHGIKSYVVRDTELASAISDLKQIDLVVTDSQAFAKVSRLVPEAIKLTSFSILFARLKGDLTALIDGAANIKALSAGATILIAEACSHNHSHEDIGRVKIPRLLNNFTGLDLNYEYKMGGDFPEELEKYDLVIHCGSCMLNQKTMASRIAYCLERGVSITNYGIVLAYLNGILPRSTEIFFR